MKRTRTATMKLISFEVSWCTNVDKTGHPLSDNADLQTYQYTLTYGFVLSVFDNQLSGAGQATAFWYELSFLILSLI